LTSFHLRPSSHHHWHCLIIKTQKVTINDTHLISYRSDYESHQKKKRKRNYICKYIFDVSRLYDDVIHFSTYRHAFLFLHIFICYIDYYIQWNTSFYYYWLSLSFRLHLHHLLNMMDDRWELCHVTLVVVS
jgi:hypothetical protein